MLNNFWENMGSKLSEKGLQYLFGPAFLFWVGSALVITYHYGLNVVWNLIQALNTFQQILLLILSLTLLLTSSMIMEALRLSFLRFFEGYWDWPISYLADTFSNYQKWKIGRAQTRWNTLKRKEEKVTLNRQERDVLARLELNLHYTPADPNEIQPTALGNILRAAESAPRFKYGLDTIVCWPRLWMLLPIQVQEELTASRGKLDQLVELGAWGILFLIWSWWAPLAGLFGLIWIGFVYAMLLRSASIYADLIESTFDLFRWELYKSMHWPMPSETGEKEVSSGKQLTEFLWRGTISKKLIYKKILE